MRVAVTGATGFIGGAMIFQLLEAGHEVCAVVRPGSSNLPYLLKQVSEERKNAFTWIELPLAQIEELPGRVTGVFDAFVHMGWDGAGSDNRTNRELQQRNVMYGLEAVRTAAVLGCKTFLFTGSQAEYGVYHQTITEDLPCFPVSEYGKAKTEFANEAKNLCKILKMEYIHTRIFSVYGPGDHAWSLVNTCLKTWQANGEMKLGECTQKWNFLYIKDAAAALIALLKTGKGGIYNVAGEDTRGLREYIEEMYAICGKQGSFHYGERPQNAEGPADLMPDISKICEVTGWRPETSFAEGIHETLHSLQEGIA